MKDNKDQGVRWGTVLPDKVWTNLLDFKPGQFHGRIEDQPKETDAGFWDVWLR